MRGPESGEVEEQCPSWGSPSGNGFQRMPGEALGVPSQQLFSTSLESGPTSLTVCNVARPRLRITVVGPQKLLIPAVPNLFTVWARWAVFCPSPSQTGLLGFISHMVLLWQGPNLAMEGCAQPDPDLSAWEGAGERGLVLSWGGGKAEWP